MRVGIVGAGFMGQIHAAAWAKTPATLAGFVDKTAVSDHPLIQKYNAQPYANLDAMLADVDVVDICTPTPLHHTMALQAAAAGKHIICEKPLARTVAQAQEMVDACVEAGVKLLVAHVVRFFPEYALAQKIIASGEIGETAVMRFSRCTAQPKKPANNWFLDEKQSGGLMLDLMIHDLDFARWIAGEVKTVFAKKITSSHEGAVGDHGLAILTHENGTISHVEASWAYPPPMWRTRFEISGTNGVVSHDSDETAVTHLHLHQTGTGASGGVALPNSPLAEDPFTTEIKSFYHHLADGAETAVSAIDGLAAVQISLAAIESAKTGQPVSLVVNKGGRA